jgi:hypothetical protein
VGTGSASAASSIALPYCWGATYGGSTAQICAANDTWIHGTLVDPEMQTDCIIKTDTVATMSAAISIPPVKPCTIVGTVVSGVEDTGLGTYRTTTPYLSGGSVRMSANTWATVWVDGVPHGVFTDSLCVGGGCPTTMDTLVNLVSVQ